MRVLSFAAITVLCLAAGVEVAAQKAGKEQPSEKKPPGPPKPPPPLKEFGGKTPEQWIALISSSDRATSSAAIKVLLVFPPDKVKRAVPVILELLKKHRPGVVSLDASVRAVAPNTLVKILTSLEKPTKNEEEEIHETLELLTKMLKDDQIVIRRRAAEALVEFGPHAHGAIDNLIDMAKYTPSFEVRLTGTTALGIVAWDKKNDPSKKVLAVLYRNFTDDSASPVRLAGLEALSNLGAPFKETLRKEFESTTSKRIPLEPEPGIKLRSYCYLYRATTDAVKAKKRLGGIALYCDKSKDPALRIEAMKFLGSTGKAALPHISCLTDGLEDKNPDIRFWSVLAIGTIGAPAVGQVPRLQKIAAEKEELEGIKKAAEDAINHIYGKDKKDKAK